MIIDNLIIDIHYACYKRKFVKKCYFNINLLKCYCFEIIEQNSLFFKSYLEPTILIIKIVSRTQDFNIRDC